MPAAVASCRVCLAMDVRLLTITGSLQLVYERITNNALHTADGRPVAACYICYAQLNKCRKLLRTSEQAENELNAIVHRQSEITKKSISLVDRAAVGLCGSLQCSGVECYDAPPLIVVKTELEDRTEFEVSPVEIKIEPQFDVTNTVIGSNDEEEEMPAAVAACRVCLAMDVRLLTIAGSLQLVYERITNNALHTADGRPVAACYICYAQLNKCRKLLRTSKQAENELNAIVHIQSEITEKSISLVDRATVGLCGSLGCSGAECYDAPPPIVVKTEPAPVMVEFEVPPVEIKIEPQFHITNTVIGNNDEEEVVASAQTSGADTWTQINGNTTNRRQHESGQESKTRTAQGPLQCDVCQQQFKCPSDVLTHYKTHTGEKPFQCSVCDRRFNQNSHLSEHMRIHTCEKPFQCNVCNSSFNQLSNLSEHMKTHTGKKPQTSGADTWTQINGNTTNRRQHESGQESKTRTAQGPLQCDVCQQQFKCPSDVLTHYKTHTGEKPFQCSVCDRRFNQNSHLSEHMRIHTCEKPFQCNVCNSSFNQLSNLSEHMKTHTGKKPQTSGADTWTQINGNTTNRRQHESGQESKTRTAQGSLQCDVCQQQFKCPSDVLTHYKTHTGEKPFQCSVCDRRFNQNSHLSEHMRIHTCEKPFQCNVCNSSFNQLSNLSEHMKTHTGKKPQTSGADTWTQINGNTTNRRQHESGQESKTRTAQGPLQCDVCQQQFKCPSDVLTHYKTHTGEKPFQCSVCDRRFNQNSHLSEHMRTHAWEKPFQCNVCKSSFNQLSNLSEHMKTHFGKKPFQCNVCDRRFKQESSLSIHLRTHSGEKRFQCSVCDHRFSHKCHLNGHMRIHTGEKPFQCNVCDQRFNQMPNLLRHLRTHTGEKPFQCSVCDRCFKERYTLSNHLKTHTGEKLFQCSVCDRRFRQNVTLSNHLRTHTGEKPFQCSVCDRRFNQKSGLSNHWKTHTGEKPSGTSILMRLLKSDGKRT